MHKLLIHGIFVCCTGMDFTNLAKRLLVSALCVSRGVRCRESENGDIGDSGEQSSQRGKAALTDLKEKTAQRAIDESKESRGNHPLPTPE